MAVYLLLIVGDDDAYQALSEDETKTVYEGHYAFITQLNEAGVKITASAEMEAPAGARTVHPDGVVTDGPFAEAKEQVGGFYAIDVPTIDDAVAWARKIPMLSGDRIEVRATK
jgi:hypothetical protein